MSDYDRLTNAAAVASGFASPEPEHLSFDVQERAIFDENGLRVASEVSSRDAALFIFADRLRIAAQAVLNFAALDDKMAYAAGEHLGEVLDTIEAYQDKAEKDATREEMWAPTRYELIAEALAWGASEFDGNEEEGDCSVDGGDMVEFFADWRERMKATFGDTPPPAPKRPQVVFETFKPGEGEPPKIFLTIKGGVVESVTADKPPGVVLFAINMDVSGLDPADLCDVEGKPAYVACYGVSETVGNIVQDGFEPHSPAIVPTPNMEF